MLKIATCAAAALFAVLSACPSPAESQQPPALNEDAPPPLTNGIYIDYGACPGEGCSIGFYLRATEEGTIVDGPTADAAAIGVTKPHEWLQVVDTQDRLIPRRGVLLRESEQLEGLKAGDVVFMLGYEGEGCSTLYRRGKSYSWCDYSWSDNQEPEIKWDEVIVPPELANQIGFGVQIRRADGQAGWVRAISSAPAPSTPRGTVRSGLVARKPPWIGRRRTTSISTGGAKAARLSHGPTKVASMLSACSVRDRIATSAAA